MPTKKAVAEKRKKRMGTPAFVVSVMFLGILVVTGAFLIGRSDTGQINVAATIQNSNEERGGEGAVGVVPEVFRDMPNGGLVPTENQDAQPATEEPTPPTDEATTTATTTEDGTQTVTEETDEVATEEGETTPPPAEEGVAETEEVTPPQTN